MFSRAADDVRTAVAGGARRRRAAMPLLAADEVALARVFGALARWRMRRGAGTLAQVALEDAFACYGRKWNLAMLARLQPRLDAMCG